MNIIGNFLPLDHFSCCNLEAGLFSLPQKYIKKWELKFSTFSKIYFYLFFIFNFYLFIYLFIYLWLCWMFVSVRGLSLVAASGGHSSSRYAGLSLWRPLLLQSTGFRRAGSATVAHGPSCSAARGIFPDQGLNPCPLHWQADSQPLRHQGSPAGRFLTAALPGKPHIGFKCLIIVPWVAPGFFKGKSHCEALEELSWKDPACFTADVFSCEFLYFTFSISLIPTAFECFLKFKVLKNFWFSTLPCFLVLLWFYFLKISEYQ